MRNMIAERRVAASRPINSPTPKQCEDCSARHIGLCDALSDADMGFLAQVAQRVAVPAGKVFIEEGAAARYVYDISEGDVRVYKSLADGRRQITGFVGIGHFLGTAVGGNYAFTAEAMTDVKLCRFDRNALQVVFREFPELERRLLDDATHELVIAQEQMLLLGRKTALERVASFLLSWAARSAANPAGMRTVKLPMSRMDLADYLGLTIETVSRSLSQLKRDGLIFFSGPHAVTLLNSRGLRRLDAGEGFSAPRLTEIKAG